MSRRVTIREAAEILGVSVDTVRRRLRGGMLEGERVETPQGYVWYVEIPDGVSPEQVPTQPPMQANVAEILAMLRQQLAVKDEQIGTQSQMMEAMRQEHAREVEQLHVLLQTAQQNEQRLLSAGVIEPDTTLAAEERRLREEAERERDELRARFDALESSVRPADASTRYPAPDEPSVAQRGSSEARETSTRPRRSWLARFFFGEG